MAGIPGGHDAVEEVHAPGHGLDDVRGGAHAHQVTGLLLRHIGLDGFDDVIHRLCRLPYGQAADGVTGQVQRRDSLHMPDAQGRIGAALVDAPEHLLRIHRAGQGVQPLVLGLAAHQPAVGALAGLLNIFIGRGVLHALVKGHADVGAQIRLDLHALLRAHKNLPPVDVGGEIHALLLDLPQGGQGKHLEASGIREDGPVPGHEPMQSAHVPDQSVPGPKMQMVGIRQHHLGAEALQIAGAQRPLDGPLGGDIHKHRRLHRPMGAAKHAPAGLALGFQ